MSGDVPAWLPGGGDLGVRIRAADWSATPLGPMETWSPSLQSALGICLGSRFPIALYWGRELTLLYNDAWSSIPGDKHPWALGQAGQAVWPEIWDAIGPLFDSVLGSGESTYLEDSLLLMHRHGYTEECYFNFTFTPVRGADGRVEGIFNAVIETTHRLIDHRRSRVLQELNDRVAQARTPLDACTLAVDCLGAAREDAPFCAVYLLEEGDAVARRVAGARLPLGEVGFPERIVLAGDPGPWPLEQVRATGRSQVVRELDRRIAAPLSGGSWPRPSHTAIVAPLLSAGAPPAGFLIVGVSPYRAYDARYAEFVERAAGHVASVVSTTRALEAERRRAEALAELDRAKTSFFSNASHELRTPLTLMLGPTEDALVGPDRALRGEALESVHRNELRLLKLVNALLDFSRIEAGRVQARYRPVDLAATTRDLAGVFRAAVERAGLALTVDAPPLAAPVYVDPEMWERIVLNLLSNALKFTFAGRIEVSLREHGDRVELQVRDSGVGVPEAELPRLFERFHRVEGSAARTHEGSGIGLALVRELVRLHGGEVRVESTLGVGTTFTVAVPRGSAHLPAGAVDEGAAAFTSGSAAYLAEALRWLPDEESGPRGVASVDPSPGASDPARLLIADDNADMRDYLSRILGARWSVVAVRDGAQALDALQDSRFDLLVTDVMMPNVDGMALLRAVRKDPATAHLPVVILSARAGEEASIEGLQAGADDYLVKPFSARELVARVQARLEIHRASQAVEQARARLHGQLMQAPVAISMVSGPDFRFELANPRYEEMIGGRSVVGRTFREAFPELPDDAPVLTMLREVYDTGRPFEAEEYCVPLDRSGRGRVDDVYFKFTCQPIRTADGRIEGLMTVAVDVTERVRSRRLLEEARQEAEQASRTKDEFLAMLGHELRNPLAPIVSAVQLLAIKGTQSREIDVIARQVQHLSRLVDDLLDISRITRGKVELQRSPVTVRSVIERALEMVSPLTEQRRQQVTVEAAELVVDADPDRLAQVLSNLLTNAAKFSDVGTVIRVRAEHRHPMVRLSVQDRGVGIAADKLDRIFDLFVQESQTIDRSRGGLGLGLAIARNLTELHGGRMFATSEGVGQGSEFVVELPVSGSHPLR